PFVQDGHRPRQPQADGAHLAVGRGAEGGGARAEHLAPGLQFHVDFQADNQFVGGFPVLMQCRQVFILPQAHCPSPPPWEPPSPAVPAVGAPAPAAFTGGSRRWWSKASWYARAARSKVSSP